MCRNAKTNFIRIVSEWRWHHKWVEGTQSGAYRRCGRKARAIFQSWARISWNTSVELSSLFQVRLSDRNMSPWLLVVLACMNLCCAGCGWASNQIRPTPEVSRKHPGSLDMLTTASRWGGRTNQVFTKNCIFIAVMKVYEWVKRWSVRSHVLLIDGKKILKPILLLNSMGNSYE